MPFQTATDRDLHRTGDKQAATGWRLLTIAAILYAAGLVFVLVGDGVADFIGIALGALGTPPGLAGLALVLSALVSRRHAHHRDFA